MIVQEGSMFVLKSKDGSKVLGKFKTRKEAVEREKEIMGITESFKISSDAVVLKEHSKGVWDVVLIQPGVTKAGDKKYSPETLRSAVPLFEGIKAYAPDFNGISDHLPRELEERHPNGFPLAVVGYYDKVRYGKFQEADGSEKEGVLARFHLLNSKLHDVLKNAWAKGKRNLLEFSINADGIFKPLQEAGKTIKDIIQITSANTVDLVVTGNAGGQFINLVESYKQIREVDVMKGFLQKLKESHPDFFGHIDEGLEPEKLEAEILKAQAKLTESLTAKAAKDADTKSESYSLEDIQKKINDGIKAEFASIRESEEKKEAKLVESRKKLQDVLAETKLSEATQKKIRDENWNRVLTESEINVVVKREQDHLASLQESGLYVPGQEKETVLEFGKDEFTKKSDAMVGMLTGQKEGESEPFQTLHQSYRSLRESFEGSPAKMARSILYEMAVSPAPLDEDSPKQQNISDHIQRLRESTPLREAQLTVSQWGQVYADALNRAMMKMYDRANLNDWRKIVSDIVPLSDFKTQHRIRIGGFGNLSIVGEGATYQPIDVPTDQEVTYAVQKRGNLVNITLESIVNDDLGAVRRMVRNLSVAAAQTLHEFVFDFIADNATLDYDSTALFHANHSNLGSTALATANSLNNRLIAMADQTEQDSGKVLGVRPKYLLVPNELTRTAWELLTAEVSSATSARTETVDNYYKTYFIEPITVAYWTDADNWYLVADPMMFPTLEIGFLNGRQEPEIFVQDQPTVGSNFTADKITYKIRHIYGGDVLEHRSFDGSVV